jgi:hypothetical protein
MDDLHLHPRVLQQGLTEKKVREIFSAARAQLVPFRGHQTHAAIGLMDWDHRIPSKIFTLRIHVCYTQEARARFLQALDRRLEEIAGRDLFPEFDVPDYAGLPADESYDVELSPELKLDTIRLVSPWRREIAEEDASRAVELVRASSKFQEVKEREPAETPGLVELEAVAWTAPCESGLSAWTLDVWWLTSFDGRLGRGWSFLVDLAPGVTDPLLAAREFAVRAA